MKRLTQSLALSAILLIQAGHVGAAEPISTNEELSDFTQNYYLKPQPERIESALRFVAASDLIQKASAKMPLRMIFSCMASQSEPSQRDQWRKLTEAMEGPAKEVLSPAFTQSPGEILQDVPPSAARNDLNWACFFATGERAYLDDIMAVLGHLDERRDLNLFLAAASAKWSLASNARRHPQVKTALETVKARGEQNMKQVIDDILTQDPAQIGREIVKIARTNKAEGNWK